MAISDDAKKILPFPKSDAKKASSTERIWGKPVLSHGYTGVPSILIKAQCQLGITPLQMNIIIQLLDYWHDPERKPFPTKQDLADRMNVTGKTIQNNMRQLEQAGLVRREARKTACGDWSSNIYHLDGLVERIKKLEPEFTEAREKKRQAQRQAEIPVGRRGS